MRITTPRLFPAERIPLPDPIDHTHMIYQLYTTSLSLAIGSPLSDFKTTVSKISAINAKHGPFDACVLAGEVFKEGSDGSEVDGISCELIALLQVVRRAHEEVPVPTYFTLGKNELPASVQAKVGESGGEVVNNLVFLGEPESSYRMSRVTYTPGKSAVLTTAQGLKIGCIGGAYDEGLYSTGADTVSWLFPLPSKAAHP